MRGFFAAVFFVALLALGGFVGVMLGKQYVMDDKSTNTDPHHKIVYGHVVKVAGPTVGDPLNYHVPDHRVKVWYPTWYGHAMRYLLVDHAIGRGDKIEVHITPTMNWFPAERDLSKADDPVPHPVHLSAGNYATIVICGILGVFVMIVACFGLASSTPRRETGDPQPATS